MARPREAIGGAVLPARIALSAALFQSVTTSAWARVPMRSAVEAEHEKSLEAFIKVNGCLIKVCLRWPRLDGGIAVHFRCAAMRSRPCRFHLTSYDTDLVGECEREIE